MKKEELLIVNPTEFGIEEPQANQILGNLPSIIEERNSLIDRYKKVMSLDIEDSDTYELAREVRLLIRDNRTKGIEQWHRINKDVFLRGGQFVDALKRQHADYNKQMEEDLLVIEKHEEIENQKRLDQLQIDRAESISLYLEDAFQKDLSSMDDDVWNAYFNTRKKEYEDKIIADKKRIEEEKIHELHRKRQDELIDLWSYLPEDFKSINMGHVSDVEFKSVKNKAEKDKVQHELDQENIRLENEKLKKEQHELDKKHKAEKDAYEEKIKKQEEESNKIKEQQKLIEKANIEAKKAKEEADKIEKNAPEKERLYKAIDSLSLPKIDNLSIDNMDKLTILSEKLTSYKKWAKKLIEEI